MGVTTTKTNKPFNPRGNDQSPKGYNRASLFSGKALDFDGVNDTITGSSSSLPASGYTIAAWFNLDTLKASGVFTWGDEATSERRSLFVWDGGSGSYYLYSSTYGSNVRGNTPLSVGRWYFGAVTLTTEGNTTIYLNGNQDGVGTNTLAAYTGTTYKIGDTGSSETFDGEISGARVFNQVLTAAQVADLYNNPEKVVPTGVDNTALKLWLPMMEGAGTTAYDGSGNGNHGTISGATYVNGIGAPVAQSAVINWNKGVNLLDEYSEDFSNSGWLKTGSSISASSESNPYGKQTWEFEVTSLPSEVQVRANISGSTPTSTAFKSFVIAKAGTLNWLRVRNLFVAGGSTEGNVWFNLSTGSVGTEQSGQTGTMTDLGDGWYKCEVSGTTAAGIPNYLFDVGFTDRDGYNEPLATGGTGLLVLSAFSLNGVYVQTFGSSQTSDVLLPQGLTTGRDITGVNLFENVRKQGALNLDGNSWAEVHDNASVDLTTSLSLEVWCYPTEDGSGSGRELIGKFISAAEPYQCWAIEYNNGFFDFGIGATDNTWSILASSTGKTKENWYHVVATYDGANRKIYVNGVEEATASFTKTPQTTDENIAIGRWLGQAVGGTNTFFGPIAQPRIYNRALTAEEVQRNYNAGKNTYTN
jgi:hypothetical protein